MKAPVARDSILVLFLSVSLAACSGSGSGTPRLVVSVVLDQVRGDLLERYDTVFSGGFRRLHDGGFRFLQATHDHAKTSTAVGHATISTGSFPSRTGIVANEWMEETPEGWRSVYSFEDSLTHVLGRPTLEGRSPKNLLLGGLADWVVARDSAAIVVSVSRKDRAAIPMAGKVRGHVYWIPSGQAEFVTSSHYADEYPGWVERFNREVIPWIFGDSVWDQTLPGYARSLSRGDTAEYEGDGIHSYFPHRFTEEVRNADRPGALTRWAYDLTPPDAAVGAFAQEAVRALGLGKDDATDYLGLSFSQPDAIGHDFGPLSREQLQNLLHLDQVLGDLMTVLDEEVGEGRWVMSVAGDHGVLTVPEYLTGQGESAGRASREDFRALRSAFADYREMEGDPVLIADSLVASLEALAFVADAVTVLDLTTGPPADSFVVLMRNSYHPDRWLPLAGSQGSGVIVRFLESYYPSLDVRGTGHGSPYYYDRHVPMIFFGTGVKPGVSADPVRTVDIAPTLARLADIEAPADLDGQPLIR